MEAENMDPDRTNEIPDPELIRMYLDGDSSAFDMLYERYRRPLYGYLQNLLRGEQANADDIFQRTWLKAIDNLHKYESEEISEPSAAYTLKYVSLSITFHSSSNSSFISITSRLPSSLKSVELKYPPSGGYFFFSSATIN